MKTPMTFDEWSEKLHKIFKDKGVEYGFTGPGPDVYRDSYDDGLSPSDAFWEEVACWDE